MFIWIAIEIWLSDMKNIADELCNNMMEILDNEVKISKIVYSSYATFYVKNQKNWIMKVYFDEKAKVQKALLNIPNSNFRKIDDDFFKRQKSNMKKIISQF